MIHPRHENISLSGVKEKVVKGVGLNGKKINLSLINNHNFSPYSFDWNIHDNFKIAEVLFDFEDDIDSIYMSGAKNVKEIKVPDKCIDLTVPYHIKLIFNKKDENIYICKLI
jgi:hypothetical protein